MTTKKKRVPIPAPVVEELERRLSLGTSGADLERLTNGAVARQTISAIRLRKQTHMNADRLVILCDALGLEPEAVLTYDAEGKPWVLPGKFDEVPLKDREELERVLSFLLLQKRAE